MRMTRRVDYQSLDNTDLFIDAIYEKHEEKTGFAGEPITKTLGVGNTAGFRKKTCKEASMGYSYVVLHSTGSEPEWPDHIEPETGHFVYYGDNREPGSTLHETDKKGNKLLSDVFDKLSKGERQDIPPFFIFTSANGGQKFRGLAVPGTSQGSIEDDLVAIWRNKDGERFQNYKSKFSILNAERIKREWIEDLNNGESMTENAPQAWIDWVKDGSYNTIEADPISIRSEDEQESSLGRERNLIETIVDYFEGNKTDFEYAAVDLFKMSDTNVRRTEVTRARRDGGRDGLGDYVVGPNLGEEGDDLILDFALEAKCKKPGNSCGVKKTMRLISRIRNNQFGVFVTTSCVGSQAYEEIRDDEHPILIITGKDIAQILINNGITEPDGVRSWLDSLDYS